MAREWIKYIDLAKRILEIGPLTRPNIKKDSGINVFYADIRTTKEIKNFYKNDLNVVNDDIVPIDYVIKGTYSESLKNVEKFDYVIATHILEHIPELISFFQNIAGVMNQSGRGGVLCLTIPDKRYCFDHFRCSTSFSECYDVYIRGINNLPFRVLDQCISWTINDAVY
jgi:16S rRNA A1518/A1519 N6-dimethyltransferase RsmA/KsgA/DIM1 with predicted DNA glycosylase/AP lyase activity